MEIVQNSGARVETGGGTEKMGGGKAQTGLLLDLPDLVCISVLGHVTLYFKCFLLRLSSWTGAIQGGCRRDIQHERATGACKVTQLMAPD